MGKYGKVTYRNHLMAWNPSGDPEWRFRKTLDKEHRDEFDALAEDERLMIVEAWQLEQDGFKF